METTGQRLKVLRKEQGYTLEQVGEFLDTTKVTISRYENDVRVPTSDPMSKLAKLYNVSSDYLLCLTDKRLHLQENTKIENDETEEDKIEVANRINHYMKELSSKESLALNGEPMCEEALESLLNAMEIGLKMAQKKQKEKLKQMQREK